MKAKYFETAAELYSNSCFAKITLNCLYRTYPKPASKGHSHSTIIIIIITHPNPINRPLKNLSKNQIINYLFNSKSNSKPRFDKAKIKSFGLYSDCLNWKGEHLLFSTSYKTKLLDLTTTLLNLSLY